MNPPVTQGLSIEVSRRFRGPPESGNGGYVCGRLASLLDGPVQVRLSLPPPLNLPMEVRRQQDTLELWADQALVAKAWRVTTPSAASSNVPVCPSLEAARAASKRFQGFDYHAFPGCFVCGVERQPGDGLCVYPGVVDDSGLVACNWTPDPSLGDENGHVTTTFLWSALDCPSGWAFLHAGEKPAVLGELSVDIRQPVAVGQEYILCGWQIHQSGRKHLCGSALFTPKGEVLALAHSTWIELNSPVSNTVD